MKHHHHGGMGRHATHHAGLEGHRRHGEGRRHHHDEHGRHHHEGCEGRRRHHHPEDGRRGRHHGRGGRLFDHGELRLLVLAMIADQPRHGYELIKAIEERMGGSYSPSPGVIYPMLSWLEDMGYAVIEAEQTGRKRYRLTPEGEGFVAANRAAIDSLFARIGQGGAGGREAVPAPVTRAMENLKLALRLRLRGGQIDAAAAESIAAALDAAAVAVERS
jgi:DNA-binding PadR family transcriptional regulator